MRKLGSDRAWVYARSRVLFISTATSSTVFEEFSTFLNEKRDQNMGKSRSAEGKPEKIVS